jgi:EF-P beta-lysylation protein EpmB
MIPGTIHRRQTPAWQAEQAAAIRDPAELLQVLALDAALLPAAQAATALWPLRVPRGFVARMRRGDMDDPLLRQVLPLAEETVATPGFVADPVGDQAARRAPGLLHKYRGRALLLASRACSIHCRYCFRREFPHTETPSGEWQAALDYLAANPNIQEVILSGGDPLTLSNRRLAALLAALAAILHLRRLRIHTRQPTVLPARVDQGLLELLTNPRFQIVMVLHVNHPQELDATTVAALHRLRRAGVTLFNQAVLLAGVNDTVRVLAALSENLFSVGVIPYYLHLLDPVRGSAHFRVEEGRAQALMTALRAHLPGYLVPRLVREDIGQPAKTLLL